MHGYCAAGLDAHERAHQAIIDWSAQRMLGPGGRPLRLYHGSPAKPDALPFGTPGNQAPQITPGRPFFVTDHLGYARHFARGGRVQPVEVRLSRPVDLDDVDVLAELLEQLRRQPEADEILALMGDPDVPEEAVGSAYFLLESPGVMQWLMDRGHDGAVVAEDAERGIRSFALFYPDQVILPRSPERRSESELAL
jgi:hypothetical protein